MKYPEIRLIAFDLDGTVFNSDKKVSPRTLAAMQEAQRRGVVLLPATGRTLANLSGVVSQIPGVDYLLTCNGASLWKPGSRPMDAVLSRYGQNRGTPAGVLPDDAKCLAKFPIPVEHALAVFDAFKPFLPGNLKVFINGRSMCEPPCYQWEQQHGNVGFRPAAGLSTVVPDLRAVMQQHPDDVEKVVMFFRSEEVLHEARKAIDPIPGITVVQGAPDNLEVNAPGVDKGFGLREICRILNIPIEQTLALGDSENDLGMLRDAGVAGVMANGMQIAKDYADCISEHDNDHDGAAELIEKIVLGM